jgi:hypothetical protein
MHLTQAAQKGMRWMFDNSSDTTAQHSQSHINVNHNKDNTSNNSNPHLHKHRYKNAYAKSSTFNHGRQLIFLKPR